MASCVNATSPTVLWSSFQTTVKRSKVETAPSDDNSNQSKLSTPVTYRIRDAEAQDMQAVHDMIYTLAVYEKSEHQMLLTLEKLAQDFNEKRFECIVAEEDCDDTFNAAPNSNSAHGGSTTEEQDCTQQDSTEKQDLRASASSKIVAYALYFYIYSTWEGPSLYLEDVFVDENQRGSGLGTQMMRVLAKIAVSKGCQRFQWQCLDWNKPSLDFYFDKLRAFERVEDDGAKWVNVMMKRGRMEELAAEA